MLTANQNFNSQFTAPNPFIPAPRKTWWVWVIGGVAVAAAVAILIYSGGLDAMMKLLGVGASGVYDVALSSTNDWLGTGNKPFIIGEADMNGTSVFARFSAVPEDIDLSDKGLGLVTSIFNSPEEPTNEQYQRHEYTSPAADLGYPNPYLSAIQVVDFNPMGASIDYSYRFADSIDGLTGKEFLPLDLTVSNDKANGIKMRAAIIEQTVSRYIQIKFVLNNNTAASRSAVYAVDFQYKENAAVAGSGESALMEGAVERDVSVEYESVNAPDAAEINILSADLNNSIVYSAQGIDLTQGRLAYSFKTALAPGVYALTISAPLLQTKIMPFLVDQSTEINLKVGSFAQASAELVGDLNGDGVIDSGDYFLLYKQYSH